MIAAKLLARTLDFQVVAGKSRSGLVRSATALGVDFIKVASSKPPA
jgi:hypothetical protein